MNTVCDNCKYQKTDGRCKKPKRAWDLCGKGKSCFVTDKQKDKLVKE